MPTEILKLPYDDFVINHDIFESATEQIEKAVYKKPSKIEDVLEIIMKKLLSE